MLEIKAASFWNGLFELVLASLHRLIWKSFGCEGACGGGDDLTGLVTATILVFLIAIAVYFLIKKTKRKKKQRYRKA